MAQGQTRLPLVACILLVRLHRQRVDFAPELSFPPTVVDFPLAIVLIHRKDSRGLALVNPSFGCLRSCTPMWVKLPLAIELRSVVRLKWKRLAIHVMFNQ